MTSRLIRLKEKAKRLAAQQGHKVGKFHRRFNLLRGEWHSAFCDECGGQLWVSEEAQDPKDRIGGLVLDHKCQYHGHNTYGCAV